MFPVTGAFFSTSKSHYANYCKLTLSTLNTLCHLLISCEMTNPKLRNSA